MSDFNTSPLSSFPALLTEKQREALYASEPTLRKVDAVLALCDQANSESRNDLQAASRSAEAALWIADKLQDNPSRGLAHRTCANVYSNLARTPAALSHYEAALDLFTAIGDQLQAAITRSSAIPIVTNALGPEVALEWAEVAKHTFTAANDNLRLARLNNNVATVFFRQENYQLALEHWQSAYDQLQAIGEVSDQAATLRNLAVCHIGLNNPQEARHYYELARELSQEHGFDFLLHAIDYNIAYLYYLEGDHFKALQLYQEARVRCRKFDDPYHEALCSLDESDVYLELNLLKEAGTVAELAEQQFTQLQRPYEAAKATFNRAVVDHRRGMSHTALHRLSAAAAVFAREKNRLWPGQIELLRALIFVSEERRYEARRAAQLAFLSFRQNGIPRREALAQLLLAKLSLLEGDLDDAALRCEEALARLQPLQEPQALFPAFLLLGEIQDQRGSTEDAIESLSRAEALLLELRQRRAASHIRLYGLREVLDVYEHLVFLFSSTDHQGENADRVFELIERAKTRGFADSPSSDTQRATTTSSVRSQLVDQVSALRKELDWLYRRLDHSELQPEPPTPSNLRQLQAQSRAKEQELSQSLARLREKANADGFDRFMTPRLSLDGAQARLGGDTVLVTYFIAHDIVFAFVLTNEANESLPVAVASTVLELQRQLWYHKGHSDHGEASGALRLVLEHLYDELVRPLEHLLDTRHLIVVPDKLLYLIPFHALRSAGYYLAQQRSISYLPSVGALPWKPRIHSPRGRGTILHLDALGAADDLGPFSESLSDTVELWSPAAASASPDLEDLLSGTWAALHITARASGRTDNVLFSELDLGSERLTLLDLHRASLSCPLLTVDGGSFVQESPGLSDDLAAPWRVLLSAGVQSALLPIWPADYRPHRAVCRYFYEELSRGRTTGEAYMAAMRARVDEGVSLQDWAGLGLIGDPKLTLRSNS